MGYPNFGKVKTIVLPISDEIPLDQKGFKNRTGIDIYDIFQHADNYANTAFYLKYDATDSIIPAVLAPSDDAVNLTIFGMVLSFAEGDASSKIIGYNYDIGAIDLDTVGI